MTIAIDAGASRAAFDIGRVIRNTVQGLASRWIPMTILAVVFVGLPYLISGWTTGQKPAASGMILAIAGVALLNLILLLFGNSFAPAALTLIAYESIVGGEMTTREAMRAALRRWGAQFALRIVTGLLTGLASLALLVPGLIVMTGWAVATPAMMAENLGSSQAMRRSWDLTRGARWPVFGVLMLFSLLMALAAGALFGLLVGVAGSIAHAEANGVMTTIFLPLLYVVSTLVGSAGQAAIYLELRTIKEGGVASPISEVFS